MGRPSKLTLEVHEQIVRAVRGGNSFATAAAHSGIDERTFERWMAKGERARSGPYRALYDEVVQAKAEAEMRNVSILQRAAEGTIRKKTVTQVMHNKKGEEVIVTTTTEEHVYDWRAAQAWLKHRVWGQFGRQAGKAAAQDEIPKDPGLFAKMVRKAVLEMDDLTGGQDVADETEATSS